MSSPAAPDAAGPAAPSVDPAADLPVLASRLTRDIRRRTDADHSAAQIRVLSLLDQHGPSPVGRLADLDSCSQPTMTGAVNALVDRGWVTKEPSPTDARVSLVTPSNEGLTTLAAVRRNNADAVRDALARRPELDAAELETAVRVLRAVVEELGNTPPEGKK